MSASRGGPHSLVGEPSPRARRVLWTSVGALAAAGATLALACAAAAPAGSEAAAPMAVATANAPRQDGRDAAAGDARADAKAASVVSLLGTLGRGQEGGAARSPVALPFDDAHDAGGELPARLPAADQPSGSLVKRPNAVVFFAPASPPLDDSIASGVARVHAAPLMPVVCSKGGALAFGPDCASVVPARAKARLTGGELVELVRGGGHPTKETDLKAPFSPACCMYQGCFGKTVAFTLAGEAHLFLRPVIAVWPEDADVNLTVLTDDSLGEEERLEAVAKLKRDAGAGLPGDALFLQDVTIAGRRYVTTGARRLSGSGLFRRTGARFEPALEKLIRFSRATLVVGATDVNHDGKSELFVFAPWANDHTFAVLEDGKNEPGWSYSCGNI